jgi:hypothetical protein
MDSKSPSTHIPNHLPPELISEIFDSAGNYPTLSQVSKTHHNDYKWRSRHQHVISHILVSGMFHRFHHDNRWGAGNRSMWCISHFITVQEVFAYFEYFRTQIHGSINRDKSLRIFIRNIEWFGSDNIWAESEELWSVVRSFINTVSMTSGL